MLIGIRRRYILGEERIAFVKAVECLMQKPNIYPNVTGPRSTKRPTKNSFLIML
jgi:hypothetical protein